MGPSIGRGATAPERIETNLPSNDGGKPNELCTEKQRPALVVDPGVAWWRASIRISILSGFPTCVETLLPIMLDYLVPTHVQIPDFDRNRDRARLVQCNNNDFEQPAAYRVESLQSLPVCGEWTRNELLLVAQPYHRDPAHFNRVYPNYLEQQAPLGFAHFVKSQRRLLPPGTTLADGTEMLIQQWSALTYVERETFTVRPEIPITVSTAETNANLFAIAKVMQTPVPLHHPLRQAQAWGVDRCQLSVTEIRRLREWHEKNELAADRYASSLLWNSTNTTWPSPSPDGLSVKQITTRSSPHLWYQTRIVVHVQHDIDCQGTCCVDIHDVHRSHPASRTYPRAQISVPLPVPNPVVYDWLCNSRWTIFSV